MSHSSQIRAGLERSRRHGVKLGPPYKQTAEIREEVKKLREQGLSYRAVHALLTERGHTLSLSTISRIIRSL